MASPVITVYRWEGELGPFRITSECAECDFTLAQLRGVLSAHPEWNVKVEVKSWLNHCWEALLRGGWHPPVVLVDGTVVSQGTVPSETVLENAIQRALKSDAGRKLGFWRRLLRRLPPAPS